MELHIISIFPEMFEAISDYGVVGRAIKQKKLNLTVHHLRDFTNDKHRTVDGRPYGGGPGMVMLVEPIMAAINHAKAVLEKNVEKSGVSKPKVVYLSPQGQRFDHEAAKSFATESAVIMLAGRYEGVDERVLQHCVDEEWSSGDYVLSGGELPAMVMIDAITRLLPGSLGNSESAEQDSFVSGLLDTAHYSRPEQLVIDGEPSAVPDVLLSGDHKAIAEWRMQQALGRTSLRRPDLLESLELTAQQKVLLEKFKN